MKWPRCLFPRKPAGFWFPEVTESTGSRLVLQLPLLEEVSITSQTLFPKSQDLPWVKIKFFQANENTVSFSSLLQQAEENFQNTCCLFSNPQPNLGLALTQWQQPPCLSIPSVSLPYSALHANAQATSPRCQAKIPHCLHPSLCLPGSPSLV